MRTMSTSRFTRLGHNTWKARDTAWQFPNVNAPDISLNLAPHPLWSTGKVIRSFRFGKSLLASHHFLWQIPSMPHREKKVKKDKGAGGAKNGARSMQTDAQRRVEMAARSILTRFQNRSSDRK